MRITQRSHAALKLTGRRQDGEVGQPGLPLLWIAGALMSTVGIAFVLLVPDVGARVMGAVIGCAGMAFLLFGLFRSARRESLELMGTERQLIYRLRTWPGPWRAEFEASLGDVRDIQIRKTLDSPAGGSHDVSIGYEKFEATLHVRPRKIIALDKSPDEAQVRATASAVAQLIGIKVVG